MSQQRHSNTRSAYRPVLITAVLAAMHATAHGQDLGSSMPGSEALRKETVRKDVLTPQDKMDVMDVDKNQRIDRNEADAVMLKNWKSWDTDGDGHVDRAEFTDGSRRATANPPKS